MSDAASAPSADPGPGSGALGPPARRPRKRFLVIGVVIAAALGVGLFTSLGSPSSSGAPSTGDAVPTFSAPNVGPTTPHTVSVSSSDGSPTVLLFFGAWCASCHGELPPLAAAVAAQHKAGGPLAQVRVVGVDSLDSSSGATAFAKSAGVTFLVAWDPNAHITTDQFFFTGDPYAVFVRADGTIDRIVRGSSLGPAGLTADERALIPSGT